MISRSTLNSRSLTSIGTSVASISRSRYASRDVDPVGDERVVLEQHDGVLLGRQRVQPVEIELVEVVARGRHLLAPVRRREQPHLVAGDLRQELARLRERGVTGDRVEEAVHARDAGRDEPVLGEPERLRVERGVEVRAHDDVGRVLVHPAERVERRLAGAGRPAVADRLERARGVPQLDDPDVRREVDPVHRVERVVEEDDLAAAMPHSRRSRSRHDMGLPMSGLATATRR